MLNHNALYDVTYNSENAAEAACYGGYLNNPHFLIRKDTIMTAPKGLSQQYHFLAAVPVWEAGKETEMNRSLVFSAAVDGRGDLALHIAGHTRYQIFVNNAFVAAGPARAGHGYFRAEEYDLTDRLTDGANTVAILVAGYNANSFYLTDQPSFLCAELVRDGAVLFATGTDRDLTAAAYDGRVRKVQRYSFQRPFTEAYELTPGGVDAAAKSGSRVRTAPTEPKRFIVRHSPYCANREIFAKRIVSEGTAVPEEGKHFHDRSVDNISDVLKGFPRDELTLCATDEVYALRRTAAPCDESAANRAIPAGRFAVYDMGVNTTGYIRLRLRADAGTVIYAVFNERLPEEGYPDPGRDSCANAVKWKLKEKGEYDLLSFEPYTYRFIQLIALTGDVAVTGVSQFRETYPETALANRKTMPDEELQAIYDAAVETFVQNATDVFMDCPSRERGGWLCDSYFTSRVEKELTGQSLVEHDFLENFLLPERFVGLPEGMLPMCYPSDHYDGCFIHNWAMWYVVELREYLERSGDTELINAAKQRVYELVRFTEKYENTDGILADLDGWIFVEWSVANDYVRDVNYPTNMLYSLFLDSVAAMYGDGALAAKADRLRETIRQRSFNGEFFIDNAVKDGKGGFINTDHRTETCQYYAFFTGTATKERYPALWRTLLDDFGPGREKTGAYPDVPKANAFIGNYLRLQLLFREGLYDKVEKEIRAFFLPMARATGTLWENMTDFASCNHGFASHAAYWLNKMY